MAVLSCVMRVHTESMGVGWVENSDECQNSHPLFSDSLDVNEQFHVIVVKAMSHFFCHVFLALVDYIKEQAIPLKFLFILPKVSVMSKLLTTYTLKL